MELKEHVHYWLESGENDLQTAESLFASERYDWCLFIAHLVLKKMLKAFFVQDKQERLASQNSQLG